MLHSDPTQIAEWKALREQIATADHDERNRLLENGATRVRRSVIDMISTAGQGHVGGDLSITDVLTALYLSVLRIDPAAATTRGGDHFIMSKGHCAASLYSSLAFAGYFSPSALATFMAPGSDLNGHPNRNKVPGVETNTGPLGHGFPFAVGQAKAAQLTRSGARVFVAVGDGEMQEGSNWEALMAGAHHQLANLTVIVDRNRLQQGARTEDTNGLDPLGPKLDAFGWEVREIDGHDFDQLLSALQPSTTGKPVAVVANTVKGKGVSFMEDRVEWHHKVPSAEQVSIALGELVAA